MSTDTNTEEVQEQANVSLGFVHNSLHRSNNKNEYQDLLDIISNNITRFLEDDSNLSLNQQLTGIKELFYLWFPCRTCCWILFHSQNWNLEATMTAHT